MSDPSRADAGTQELLDGRYLLGECLGEGGMARVHRAEDIVLGRVVALKIMRESSDPGLDSGRLRMESTLLASLAHPSLVTLYDAHIAPGKMGYLVMELVEGPSLRERADAGPLPAAAVAALARDLADALATVHAAGIVHRDVKPSNILLAPPGASGAPFRAKLADFGIAYLTDGTRLTAPGTVLGTAAYLAPEQVRGAPAGPAADIYALGLVLLETLTGVRAFPHSTGVESIVVRLSQSPRIPGWLPEPWRELLAAMTAMDPFARPSATAVVESVVTMDAAALAFYAGDVPARVHAEEPTAAETAIVAVPPAPAPPATEPIKALLVRAGISVSEPAPPTTRSQHRALRRRRRPALMWGGAAGLAAGLVAVAVALAPTAGGVVDPAPSVTPVAEGGTSEQTPAPEQEAPAGEAPQQGAIETVEQNTAVVPAAPEPAAEEPAPAPEAPAPEAPAPADTRNAPSGADDRGPDTDNRGNRGPGSDRGGDRNPGDDSGNGRGAGNRGGGND
ncbi:serine/threonine-protein kinase [Microbacterium limosum]|uniref:Serine/threonine-protein kinase n=1 Tax=Microbacterium limosum TaxID=3079935 RepID=A0AAU0MGU3_9MICO|nr:serine/threonine-protein kinase [Microbacterium sp. Y20]WOQ69047.1 serine/threonine-protein kinase [Microbacterium sp. Y20]